MTDIDLQAIRKRARTDVHDLHAQDWECLLDIATEAVADRDDLLEMLDDVDALRDQVGLEVRDREQWEANAERAEATLDRVRDALSRWEGASASNATATLAIRTLASDIRAALDGDGCTDD